MDVTNTDAAAPDGEAVTAIRQLHARYNMAGDRGRIAELVEVFAEDGILDVPGRTLQGRRAIADFLTGVAGGEPATVDLRGSRHHLTTSRIEVDDAGDQARSWTYFLVIRAGAVIQEGSYIDRIERDAGQWRIRHRRVKILWTTGDRTP